MKHHDPKVFRKCIVPLGMRINFFETHYPDLTETERYLLSTMIRAFDVDCANALPACVLSRSYIDILNCADHIDLCHKESDNTWIDIGPSVRHALTEIRVTYGYNSFGKF